MEEQKIKGRDVHRTYFVASEENNELHKCRECSRNIKQNVKKGYTNLVVHVTTQHKDEYVEKVRAHIRQLSRPRAGARQRRKGGLRTAAQVRRSWSQQEALPCSGEERAELRMELIIDCFFKW